MPGLNGFEVVSVLQKERCQKTPLIVYTARDLSEDDKRNLTLGLTTYLIKSRTSEGELLESVKSMLDGLVSKPIATAQSLEG
jgi:CheY-like chemotaxis protein